MLRIGVQTKNIIQDENPAEGFQMMRWAGFSCADFSLNSYLMNRSLYQQERNDFFDRSRKELEEFFTPHKQAAAKAGIVINQMHMPYPNFVPGGSKQLNDYLRQIVAPKSLEICSFMECPYIVVHGFKLAAQLGSEEAEWQQTAEFLEYLAPMAKELGVTICIENLYTNKGHHIVEGPCCNAAKAAERIDRMNEKYGAEVLGFCFDTGHGNLVGLDFEQFLVTLGERVKVLHIHDNDGVADLHQLPFTFTKSRENVASTDWSGFVRGLRKINYTGVLSFETAPVLDAFPEMLKEDVLGIIAKIGMYFGREMEGEGFRSGLNNTTF